VPLQRGEQHCVILLARTGSTQQHTVQAAEIVLVAPKAFAPDPLQPVARHSRFGDLARNR
jgi:hypothetical protein